MSKNVLANGREISAAKDANQSLAAMADVCLSPPSPPAGPVPIPYPNTAKGSDTSEGSKTVKIGGDEVGLKNSSNYKQSNGDEAATKSLGMGVVTHTIQGKMKHAAWSFDVKIEGANVIRHMDLTTHNHINNPNIAATLNQAAFNTPTAGNITCSDLTADQQQTRQSKPSGQNEGTATSGSYTASDGASGTRMRAVTPTPPEWQGSAANIRAREAAGVSPGRPNTEMDKPCGRGRHSQDSRHHTETKMINQIFNAAEANGIPTTIPGGGGALGTLRMSINYSGPNGGPNWVCGNCREAICGAIDCGLDIELCEGGNTVTTAQVNQRCQTRAGWPA